MSVTRYALTAPSEPLDRRFVAYSERSMSISRADHELGPVTAAVFFSHDDDGLRRAEDWRDVWMAAHPDVDLRVVELAVK